MEVKLTRRWTAAPSRKTVQIIRTASTDTAPTASTVPTIATDILTAWQPFSQHALPAFARFALATTVATWVPSLRQTQRQWGTDAAAALAAAAASTLPIESALHWIDGRSAARLAGVLSAVASEAALTGAAESLANAARRVLVQIAKVVNAELTVAARLSSAAGPHWKHQTVLRSTSRCPTLRL